MHLVITIPAYNEEKTIAGVIQNIPAKIPQVDKISLLVIDDGSQDRTVDIALRNHVTQVLVNSRNIGLAQTFFRGIRKALELGADIIVNIDADGQYDPKQIIDLVRTLLETKAGLVNGNRQVAGLTHMKMDKKYGNMLGSLFVRMLTGCKVVDVSSGFRAYARDFAQTIYLHSTHTYTHEVILHAFYHRYKIVEVPVNFYPRHDGGSRLIQNVPLHISKSLRDIFIIFFLYGGVRFLLAIGTAFNVAGLLLFLRYLYLFVAYKESGHIQSLIAAAVAIGMGVIIIVLAIVTMLVRINRNILEKIYLSQKAPDV